MNIIHTSIPDVIIIEPKVFQDSRGFFLESYNQKTFTEELGITPKKELTADKRGWTQINADKFVPQPTRKCGVAGLRHENQKFHVSNSYSLRLCASAC